MMYLSRFRAGRSAGSGRKVGVVLDAANEGREQPRDVRQVLQTEHLSRGMHVAQGDADQTRRHPGAGELDGVGIGAGAAGAASSW